MSSGGSYSQGTHAAMHVASRASTGDYVMQDVRRDRSSLPKLRIQKYADAALLTEQCDQCLNHMQTTIATCSSDAEEHWAQAVAWAKEAHVSPAERAPARGLSCKLLDLKMPERVPTFEKQLRAELTGVIPARLYRGATARGCINATDMRTPVMYAALPCEAQWSCPHLRRYRSADKGNATSR